MERGMMNNLAVASNGHCFFCLSQIMPLKLETVLLSPLPKQINSLQYLSRYLKMDQKKVFIDKEHVSPELLGKVEKARLKVELCEECRCLSEKFSEGYRQLEKLEMELGSTLTRIYGKLASADETGKIRNLAAGINSNWTGGLLEVLNVLRGETIQKSIGKLAGTPRVKIQNLTKKEIRAKQFRVAKKSGSNQESSKLTTATNCASDSVLETRGVVPMESLHDECLSDDDNGNYLPDDVASSSGMEPMEDDTGKWKIESGVNEDVNRVISETGLIVHGSNDKPKRFSINPETGKHKCNVCKIEFNNYNGFMYHYQTFHLKVRYQCVACNKLFSHKGNLQQHQRTSRSCSVSGSAPKYNCHLCEKSFTQNHNLQKHLDKVHSLSVRDK